MLPLLAAARHRKAHVAAEEGEEEGEKKKLALTTIRGNCEGPLPLPLINISRLTHKSTRVVRRQNAEKSNWNEVR